MREIFSIYLNCWRKFGHFRGRARRREFAVFYFGNIIIAMSIFLMLIACIPAGSATNTSDIAEVVFNAFGVITLIPIIAITIRRVQDLDLSRPWLFLLLVPLIGGFFFFYLMLAEGTRGTNRFGPDPKAPPPNQCTGCSYDLTGNVTGICPECGVRIGQRAMPED